MSIRDLIRPIYRRVLAPLYGHVQRFDEEIGTLQARLDRMERDKNDGPVCIEAITASAAAAPIARTAKAEQRLQKLETSLPQLEARLQSRLLGLQDQSLPKLIGEIDALKDALNPRFALDPMSRTALAEAAQQAELTQIWCPLPVQASTFPEGVTPSPIPVSGHALLPLAALDRLPLPTLFLQLRYCAQGLEGGGILWLSGTTGGGVHQALLTTLLTEAGFAPAEPLQPGLLQTRSLGRGG